MGSVLINFAEYGEVPDGDHHVEVTRITLRDKLDGTNQYLLVDLTVVEGPYADHRIDMVMSLRSDLLRVLKHNLATFGLDASTVELRYEDEGGERVVLEPNLVGRRAVAVVAAGKVRRLLPETES